jgi:hypothetical protein
VPEWSADSTWLAGFSRDALAILDTTVRQEIERVPVTARRSARGHHLVARRQAPAAVGMLANKRAFSDLRVFRPEIPITE